MEISSSVVILLVVGFSGLVFILSSIEVSKLIVGFSLKIHSLFELEI